MERITKGMVDRQARILNDLLGRPQDGWITTAEGNRITQDGHLFVEHGPCGFRLVEYRGENGGEFHPLGNGAYTLRELYNVLFAVRESMYNKWAIVEHKSNAA